MYQATPQVYQQFSMASQNKQFVPIEEFNKLKRKVDELEAEFQQAKKQKLEEAESKMNEDEKKLKQFEAVKPLMADGMQIRLEKPKRARIALELSDFVNWSDQYECDSIENTSDPVELVGFKWELEAGINDENSEDVCMFLSLIAHPPQHYKGDFKFNVDISFRLLHTLSFCKDMRKELLDVEIKKGWNYWFDFGEFHKIHGEEGHAETEIAKIQKLTNPKNGFLQEDGSVRVEVDFIVKSATFDHLLMENADEADNGEHMGSGNGEKQRQQNAKTI